MAEIQALIDGQAFHCPRCGVRPAGRRSPPVVALHKALPFSGAPDRLVLAGRCPTCGPWEHVLVVTATEPHTQLAVAPLPPAAEGVRDAAV